MAENRLRARVSLHEPRIEELWFREKMLCDEQTMSYNHAYGGTIPFPKERWADWYGRWIVNHNGRRFYRYVAADETFVGEAAYHLDEERQMYVVSLMIYAPFRGKGYGHKALQLLCQAARDAGIRELYDDIAIDNSSVALFLKCGFTQVLRTGEYVLVKKELNGQEP